VEAEFADPGAGPGDLALVPAHGWTIVSSARSG
jgi:hypothetical protein